MVNGVGELIWGISGRHFQSIDVGKVRSDLFGNQIVVDAASDEPDENGIWVLDENGNVLTIITTITGRIHRLINWFGGDVQSILIAEDRTLYDGYGNKLATLDTPVPKGAVVPDEGLTHMAFTGDMTGDGIPDIVMYTNPGSMIYVYENVQGIKPRGEVPLGTGVNYTLY